MTISIPDFWKLLLESRLISPDYCQRLGEEFGRVKGAATQGNARTLSEWLISRSVISRYQATLLMAGRSGPFFYGDYRIYDRIESGRLAGMFRAVHGSTNHPVLLQFLTGAETQEAASWARLAARSRSQCTIQHPHLARAFELVDIGSFKFLVLEDLRGQCLDQQLSGGRLAPQEACRLAYQAALGLAHLHGQNLVHGDVRPVNLWIDRSGMAKLLRDPLHPPVALPLGMPDANGYWAARGDYAAPELAQAGAEPTALSDIYALGCTLYQAIAGQPPFPGGDLMAKLQRHAAAPIQPLEPLGAPPPVAQMVVYMMAKNPAVRYQHAGQIAEQLSMLDPSLRSLSPPAPPATLAGYEYALREKQLQLAAQAPVAAPAGVNSGANPAAPLGVPVGAPVGSPVGAPLGSGVSEAPKFGALAGLPAGASSPAGVSPLMNPDAPAVSLRGDTSQAVAVADDSLGGRYTPKQVAQVLGGAGAALIALILLINYLANSNEAPVVADRDGAATTEQNPAEEEWQSQELTAARPRPPSVNTSSTQTEPPATSPPATGGSSVGPPATEPPAETPQFVSTADNGTLLWAPPTAGPPVDLTYLPPGAQWILVVRPAAMKASPEGALVLQALGDDLTAVRSRWEQAAGVALEDVEQLIIGLYDNDLAFPRVATVVRLAAPQAAAQHLARWGNPPATPGAAGLHRGGAWMYYLPPAEGGQVFVMGEPAEFLAGEGPAARPRAGLDGVPALRLELEKLRRRSDADRHVTLLTAPRFLFSGGRTLLGGPLEKLRDPLDRFLGDGMQAAMLSCQFDADQAYVELRMISTLDRDPQTLARDLRDRLEAIPSTLENYLVELSPHPYWRKLAFRYPQMVRFLHARLRVGVEDDQAIVNCVLPGPAAHNLVAATELTLRSTPGVMVAAGGAAAGPAARPVTLEDALATRLTVAFPAESLEFALRDLAIAVRDAMPTLADFEIKIIGPDLQMNGITRNQQIRDFNLEMKPVSEILTAFCMKANPVTTVQDPSEADQKLLWVVAADPDNASRKVILVTTRDAATARNYELPTVFRLK